MDVRKKEIYKEMDDYIGFLRKKETPNDSESIFSIFKRKKKKEKIEPKPEFSEVEVSEKKEAPEIEEEVQEEEKKINFLSFITNLFKRKKIEKEEDITEDTPEEVVKLELYKTQMEEDAKKALKIADELIKKIPNFELRKFMQSKDYEVYESVMKKYKLR